MAALRCPAYIEAMAREPIVKICGLNTEAALAAALEGGADMVGFVFFPPSPRHLDFDRARRLAANVDGRAQKVALTVDADDDLLARVVEALEPDLLQLHGRESPERTAQVRARFGLPVAKAIGVATAADLAWIGAYEPVVDMLLFDAKPSPDATRPGGNGRAFDWSILRACDARRPWLLSGGLTSDNVIDAIDRSGASGVDVSSGVEISPGVKDPAAIAHFLARAKRRATTAFLTKNPGA
jgi:phosphoribosylanthranilate isomerase